jgi:ABC-2 type transport system ATP-binding protein
MESLLRMRDIWVGDASRARLQGVDLDLAAGDRLGLLGVNGAGKSTLLAVLAGSLSPTRGTIEIDGATTLAERRRRVGYLPQRVACYPELTVRENLDWVARLHGLGGIAVGQAIERSLSQTAIADQANRLAGHLSSGMQQRLGLAQALVASPQVLLLDEPTASLDPVQMDQIRALIRDLPATVSVILATHLFDDVLSVCDRVAIMDAGRKIDEHPVEAGMDLMQHFQNTQEGRA